MPLTEVLERLYARRRFGIKPGVERVVELLRRLGNPENNFRTIHVAGTNGKGSTSAFLSSILLHSGHSVAQFSSPHLVRFTERFRINGEEYTAEKLADRLANVLEIAQEDATFFEITTALAAYIFCEERIDWAIMEAGMGGRSDATAAFNGELTIITQIAYDHTEYLGTTLEEIAREKAGIIKPGTLVVCANQADTVKHIIKERCNLLTCRLSALDSDFSAHRNSDGSLDYQGMLRTMPHLVPGLAGSYQTSNAAVALAAAEALESAGVTSTRESYQSGLAAARWPGRMELVPGTPPLLLDGAHNPAGIAALTEALAEYSYNRLLLVTGACRDKDVDQMYAPLLPLANLIYTVTPGVERALPAEELSLLFGRNGIASQPCASVDAGIIAARNEASRDDLILICGSLFVVGEAKAWLEQVPYHGIRG